MVGLNAAASKDFREVLTDEGHLVLVDTPGHSLLGGVQASDLDLLVPVPRLSVRELPLSGRNVLHTGRVSPAAESYISCLN